MTARIWLLLLLLLLVPTASAQVYTVSSAYDRPMPAVVPHSPEPVAATAVPIWILLQMLMLPLDLIVACKAWLTFGLFRIRRGEVLDQNVRARIHAYIRDHPGVHLHGLADGLEVRMGTLRYHLRILERARAVAVRRDGTNVRYFEGGGQFTEAERRTLSHLYHETSRRILVELCGHSAATRQELAHALGVTPSTITWHLRRLAEDRIVAEERSGRSVRYRLADEAAACLGGRVELMAPA
ncbi:MAG: helix-turn-helix domain-containing protein [Methanospirillum sp.]